MGRVKVIEICQNELFFIFKFFQFRHRLNYCIMRISFGLVLLKLDHCIISGFPRVLVAAQQQAVTSC